MIKRFGGFGFIGFQVALKIHFDLTKDGIFIKFSDIILTSKKRREK